MYVYVVGYMYMSCGRCVEAKGREEEEEGKEDEEDEEEEEGGRLQAKIITNKYSSTTS